MTLAPARDEEGAAALLLLALGLLLAPALGAPTVNLLQDTLKSAIVAFAALGAGLLFVLGRRGQSGPLRWHPVLWLPLLLMAYALGSMGWSHTYLAAVEAIRWFLFAWIAWLALNTLSRDRLPLLAACVHAGAVVGSAWAAWQFWGGLTLFPQGPQPASTFVNRNFFAEFAVCALPFAALLLAQARRTPAIALLAASSGFVLVAILMTGTRSALIATGLLLVTVFPLAAWRCRGLALHAGSQAQRMLAFAAVVATVLLLGNIPSINPRILEEGHGATPIARGLHRAQSVGPSDRSLNIRMAMWRDTLHAIRARPLAGLGAGAWENEIPLYAAEGAQLESDYSVHNEFLQLVAEYGLAGWAFLLLFLAWLLRAAGRTLFDSGAAAEAERPLRAVLLASLLALMVVSTIGFPWHMAVTGMMFAVCVGGLAASDARLGLWVRPLRWTPALGRAMTAACLACFALAVAVTVQAVRAESRLVQAAGMAFEITASGAPDHPRFAPAKARMLQLVREGIAINPHYRKITPMVADELARWGQWADALWIWESVLASRPNVLAIRLNVARAHEMLGRHDEAWAALEQARRLQPRSASMRSLEVLMLARGGQEALALRKAQEALAEGIADEDLVNAAFVLAERAGQHPLARAKPAAPAQTSARSW